MGEKSVKTNVIRSLEQHNIGFETRIYDVDENDLSGTMVAVKIGLPCDQVFKTLVARGDKTGVVLACVPVSGSLDLKKLAAVSGNKKVEMVPLSEVLSLTGYIRGGVSPIGTRRVYPVYIDETAVLWPTISISAGQRGVQVILTPSDLVFLVDGVYSDIASLTQ